jgi:hypothetical protein
MNVKLVTSLEQDECFSKDGLKQCCVVTSHDSNVNQLTPQSRVLLENLTVAQLVNKSRVFYGIKGSLPRSQQPASSH